MAAMNHIECEGNRATGYVVLGLLCSVVFVECNRAAWQAAAQGAVAASAPPTPTALLFFGGQDDKTFLGFLNRSEMS